LILGFSRLGSDGPNPASAVFKADPSRNVAHQSQGVAAANGCFLESYCITTLEAKHGPGFGRCRSFQAKSFDDVPDPRDLGAIARCQFPFVEPEIVPETDANMPSHCRCPRRNLHLAATGGQHGPSVMAQLIMTFGHILSPVCMRGNVTGRSATAVLKSRQCPTSSGRTTSVFNCSLDTCRRPRGPGFCLFRHRVRRDR